MRVVLVGSPAERVRLRAEANGSFVIAGEFPDLASARSSGIDADAFLVTADGSERSLSPRPVASAMNPVASATNPVASPFPGLSGVEGRRKDSAGGGDAAPMEPLTDREVQVLGLLAEGLSNKGIAARLGISDQTVKFHVASISGKLGAHNRTEAVRLGVRRGLIAL
jgi:DNA-binding CsgD family transcriptional regulator